MSRSSYRETQSRTAVIFWSNLLFMMGIAAMATAVGALGPLFINDPGTPISNMEHGIWAGGAVVILAVLVVGKMWLTGTDGHKIAKSMGATQVNLPEGLLEVYEEREYNRKIADFAHYVETCSLAAGMTEVPGAYVLFEESGLNAFAAGSGSGKSVVAITEGALLAFDRDELEGVVGHEVAHITQGDTSYAMKIIALCTALMIFTEIGRLLMYVRGGKDNKLAIFGIVVCFAGLLGTLFARLMQAYLSRQAEFRADASGALYAGTTRGLVSALKKIESTAAVETKSKIPQACAHMLLAPPGNAMGFGAKVMSLSFATHPPTKKRIAALEGESILEAKGTDRNSPFES